MEPITTTAAISAVVTYLTTKLKDNKSIQGFFDDFTEAVVNTIKPIFITTDGEPKETIKELQAKPDSEARQEAVKSSLAVAVEDNAQLEPILQEMVKVIQQKDPDIGTKITINQTHSGSGSNIGRDQINYRP